MKLQSKVLALLIPVIVFPLLTLGWVSYTQLRHTAEERTLEQMGTLLDQIAVHARSVFSTAVANVELLSGDRMVRQYLRVGDSEGGAERPKSSLEGLFARFQRAHPSYFAVRLILPDGTQAVRRVAEGASNALEDPLFTPQIRAMIESNQDIYAKVFRRADNSEPSLLVGKRLPVARPSSDRPGGSIDLNGYLALALDMDFVREQLNEARIGDSGLLFVTDGSGRVLMHPDDLQRGQVVHGDDGVPFQFTDDVFAWLKPYAENRLPARAVLGGEVSLILGRKLHDDLFLFARLSQRELLAVGNELGSAVARITAVAIIGALSLFFLALRRLVIRPIGSLRVAAREIGHGNLRVDIPVASPDEIGDLARSLAEMGRNLHRSNEQIRYLAYHDNLTGLPNRLMFLEYLNHALAHARRNNESLALLFLDVDNFKHVNDTLGHNLGDTLLQELSDRLTSCLRDDDYVARTDADEADDLVARLGGDEFIILLRGLKDPYEAGSVAKRILKALSAPFAVGSHEFYVSASIGITVYPTDGASPDDLIKHADIAMYHAKEHGKNNYQYFSESMNAAAIQRFALEAKLRKALAAGELHLDYQPQIDAQSGEILGVEALVRWRDPEVGVIPPDVFIPVAEESGLIVAIGEWVLNEACRQNRSWQDAGLPKIPVAVNVSRLQATRRDLRTVVADALRRTRLDPRYLDLELTETIIMSAEENAEKTLNEIRSLGVSISMDDFGTGYSSLGSLRRFPIQKLKIDRSFIHQVLDEESDAAIIAAIIAMAKVLGLHVIAEGVETDEQLAFLREQGCDAVQGFVCGRPMAARDITNLLGEHRRKSA